MAAAPTLFESATTTPVVGTESFFNVNVDGVFTFHIDTINMAAGDVLQVRAYQMVLTGGTSRVLYIANYQGAQPTDDLIKITPPIGNDLTDSTALRFSILQTFGTARAFPQKILQY